MGESVQAVGPQRNIELIIDNSDQAARLTNELLFPAADFFAGENFASSDIAEIEQERTISHADGMTSHVAFTATKVESPEDLEEGEQSPVNFIITLTIRQPYTDGMFWPGVTDLPLKPGDEVLAEYMDEDQEGDTLAPAVNMSNNSVAEVWEYYLDGETTKPRKSLRWLYYEEYDDEPSAVVEGHCEEELADTILGEDPDEETMLRAMDREVTEAYSSKDVHEIIGLLKQLGFHSDFVAGKPLSENETTRRRAISFNRPWLRWLVRLQR